MAQKLMDDQGIDSSWNLAKLSDEIITMFCDVIRRPGSLVSGKMPDRRNQISVLMAKNLKLTAFMFKMIKRFSKAYDIQHVSVLASMGAGAEETDTQRYSKLTRTIGQKLWRT